MKVNNTERWLRLFMGMVALLFAGIIYTWSILKMPFAVEFGWNPAILGLNSTLTICFFCIGGFISGLLSKKLSPKTNVLIGAVLLFTGFFITSRLNTNSSHITLYLAYGVVAGTGIGFVYNTVVSSSNAWFPDKKGLSSGILMMGFGLTTLIIGKAADAMMKSQTIGWQKTYLILAVVIGVVLLTTALFIKTPPEGTVFPPAKTGKRRNPEAPGRDFTAKEMVKRPSFWLLFIFLTMLAGVGTAAISFVTDVLEELGSGQSFAVTAAGILSIFNGVGRLVSGTLFDVLGRRRTQYVMSSIAIAAPLAVVVAILTGSLAIGLLGIAMCYFAFGFAPTTSASFAAAFYGTKNFSLNFSILNLVLIPAPFAATLAGNLYKTSGSFVSTFIILACCSIVGLIVNLALKEA